MSTHVEQLQERMVRGANVTPKQLAEARAADEFRELKARADEQIAARAFEQERRAALEEIRRAALERFEPQALDASRARVEAAVEDYVGTAAAHNAAIKRLDEELRAGGFLVGTTPGPVEGLEASDGNPTRVGDVVVHYATPRGLLENVVAEALARHFPRGVG
jgi:hypothetical protein